jgi:hypothetical protein
VWLAVPPPDARTLQALFIPSLLPRLPIALVHAGAGAGSERREASAAGAGAAATAGASATDAGGDDEDDARDRARLAAARARGKGRRQVVFSEPVRVRACVPLPYVDCLLAARL